MTEVHAVFAQVASPKGDHPGIVVDGAYTVVDGVVTLTTREGEVMRDENGKIYRHTLQPGDNPKAIAARLTKQLRLRFRGKNAPLSGFSGPINYPKQKWV